MRFKALKSLIRTNIIYTTPPSSLTRFRQKQAKKPDKKINVSRQLIMTHLFTSLLYLLIFGVMSAFYPLVDHPGIFTNMVSIFSLMVLSQGFLSFYNVFYESKDLQSYRPYAFSEAEIMIGKSISVVLTVLLGALPILAYFVNLQIQSGNPIWLAIPIVLISLVVLGSVLAFGILTAVHFITKTSVFRQHKQVASNILLGVTNLLIFGSIILVNTQNRELLLKDTGSYLPPMESFYYFGVTPFEVQSLIGIGAWALVAVLLFSIVKWKVLPEFYEAALKTSETVNKKQRVRKFQLGNQKSFPRFVWSYQLSLISDGSVFLQSVFMSSVMPYLFILPGLMGFIQGGGFELSPYLTPKFLLPLMLITVFIATFNAGSTNLTMIGISLERENFSYLKVLPFDMKAYLRLKFWYLFLIQSILPLLIFVVVNLLLGTHWLSLLVMVLVWISNCLAWSIWGFQRDHRLLVTNWSNVTELFNRSNNTLKTIIAFLILFVFIAAIGGSYALIFYLKEAIVYGITLGFFLIIMVLSGVLYFHYANKFKKALE